MALGQRVTDAEVGRGDSELVERPEPEVSEVRHGDFQRSICGS